MATRKKPEDTAPPDDQVAETFVENELGDDQGATLDMLADMLDSYAEMDAIAKVYRIRGQGEKDLYLTEFSVAEFMGVGMPKIQRRYGAGLYRVRLFGFNEKLGRNGPLWHGKFELGEPVDGTVTAEDEKARNVNPLDTVSEFFKRMDEREAARAQNPVVPVSPANSMKEMLEMMLLLKELNPPPPPPPDTMAVLSQVMAMVRGMREVSEEINPPPADTNSLLSKGMDMAVALMAGAKNGAQPQNAMGGVPALGAPEYQVNPTPPQTANGEHPMNFMLKIALKHLMEKAQNNADVIPVADEVMKYLSDDVLIGFLVPDNWMQQIVQVLPEAAQFPDWFARLRAEILSRYDDGEDSPGVPQQVAPNVQT